MALRHLGLSQEMHWPVLTSNDSVWGERIALLFQEPAQCQPHFNHSEVLCCVAKTALKKKDQKKREGRMAVPGSAKGWSGAGGCLGKAEHRDCGPWGAVGGCSGPVPSLSWLSQLGHPSPCASNFPAAQLGPV